MLARRRPFRDGGGGGAARRVPGTTGAIVRQAGARFLTSTASRIAARVNLGVGSIAVGRVTNGNAASKPTARPDIRRQLTGTPTLPFADIRMK